MYVYMYVICHALQLWLERVVLDKHTKYEVSIFNLSKNITGSQNFQIGHVS